MPVDLIFDPAKQVAVLVGADSGEPIGPVAHGPDAVTQIETFLGLLDEDPEYLGRGLVSALWYQFSSQQPQPDPAAVEVPPAPLPAAPADEPAAPLPPSGAEPPTAQPSVGEQEVPPAGGEHTADLAGAVAAELAGDEPPPAGQSPAAAPEPSTAMGHAAPSSPAAPIIAGGTFTEPSVVVSGPCVNCGQPVPVGAPACPVCGVATPAASSPAAS